MIRNPNRPARIFVAALGLTLVAGAVTFAKHNQTLAKVFAATTAHATAGVQQEAARASVADRPLVKVSLSGAVERNNEFLPVEKAEAVRPGEVLTFTVNSVNEGTAPAREYRTVGQIPKGTSYVESSARGEGAAEVSYSIDGGRSFSAQPMIEETQADGTVKKVPAPVSVYTQVRFQWADPLAAGGKVSASYQVQVK